MPQECFRKIFKNFQRLLKIAEGSTDVLIVHQQIKYTVRVKHNVGEVIDIFISEDLENMPPTCKSRMRFCINFTSGVFSSKTLMSIQKNQDTKAQSIF